MHTRRLASFILGMWLLGSLFFTFVTMQSVATVDRIMENPPGPVAKDIEDLGSDITRLLLAYEASELNRFLTNTWEVMQMGLGAAFLSSVLFTSHRSKYLIVVSIVMLLIVAVQTAYISPSMASLGRSFDFMPKAAQAQERENYRNYEVMYSTASTIKLLLGLTLAARLLFDRYAWKKRFSTEAPKELRRRRRSSSSSPESGKVAEVVPVPQAIEEHKD
jgi:hypothetical protein